MAAAKATVTITPLVEKTVAVRVVGDSPLIVHAWSEKAKGTLPAGKRALALAAGKDKESISKKKEYETPVEQFMNSLYWVSEKPSEYTEKSFEKALKNGAKFGVKAESFKAAAISGAYSKKWIPNKKGVQGLFFIEPDFIIPDGTDRGTQLVEIKGCVPEIKEDIVRLSGNGNPSDIRWRPMFTNWYVDLKIKYDIDGLYSIEDIINMINVGGHYYGVGEWRPEKGGQYGMYHVEAKTKIK